MLLTPERSEEIKSKIQAAVEAALRDQDVSARRASLDVVGNDGLIRDIRAGRLPGVDRLDALFEYLGLEFQIGPRRMFPSPTPSAGGFAEAGGRAIDFGSREALRAGYLPIPWHPQAPRPSGQPAAPVAFATLWLDAAGLDPETLAAVCPEPEPGAAATLVLIDTAAPRRGGPARWCYRAEARALTARVQFEPGATVILPDPPETRARVFAGDSRARLALLGRVVWSGRLEDAGDAGGRE